ncbi:MAG: ATP/GTP-binding protein [Micromonosporaceae bacterium]|nr:ATP/GTP-binding protein [Micromonosporaceae bacterium]
MVGSISEIPPLTTEVILTSASIGVDDASSIPGKTTTTVAMDFGRITLEEHLILYLFGTPGQQRFWFMWDEVARGAIGAVVLVDARRLADSFGPLDYFEARHLPYVVVANTFSGQPVHDVADVREALVLAADVPLIRADVREREDVAAILTVLVEHALDRRRLPTRRPSS